MYEICLMCELHLQKLYSYKFNTYTDSAYFA